jgi:hypothetical protein
MKLCAPPDMILDARDLRFSHSLFKRSEATQPKAMPAGNRADLLHPLARN